MIHHAAQLWVPNSDNASAVLQGTSLLHGNLVLHGWSLGADPFWTSELPVFAAADAVLGAVPAVVSTVATAIWAGVGLAVAWVASRGLQGVSRVAAPMLAFSIVEAPIVGLLHGPIHVGTALLCLAGLGLAAGAAGRPAFAALAIAVLAAAAAGDPLAYLVALVPGLVAAILWAVPHRSGRAAAAWAAGMLAAAILLALVLTRAAHHFHGFTAIQVPGRVHVDLASAQNTVSAFVALLAAAPVPMDVPGALLWAARVALLAAGAVGLLVAAARALREGSSAPSWLWTALALGVAANLAGQAFYSTDAAAAGRRLVPALLFVAVLAGRGAAGLLRGTPRLQMAVALAAVASAVPAIVATALTPVPVDRHQVLARWLLSRGLTGGYGDYWDSNIVTVDSGGRVAVRPVVEVGGRLGPFGINSYADWYRRSDRPMTFLVFSRDGPPVDASAAEATFGRPKQRFTVDGYFTVLVWNSDLATRI